MNRSPKVAALPGLDDLPTISRYGTSGPWSSTRNAWLARGVEIDERSLEEREFCVFLICLVV